MSGDWYTNIANVADSLTKTAKTSFSSIHDQLTELTSGLDTNVFNNTHGSSLFVSRPPVPPPSQWDTMSDWVIANKYAIIAITSASGIGALFVYRAHSKKHRKRRAVRTPNASRKEVLIMTNFTTNAIAKVVALDLERRGFIVFCACQTLSDKLAIENEGRADIRPLLIQKGESPYAAIEKFGNYLNVPAPAYHGGHTLHFAGLILAPPAPLPTGPLEIIDKDQVVHAVDTGLLWPTSVVQYFLPLLREHAGRTIFLNDWIIPSLHTPFYAPAVLTSHAIQALSQTMSREVPSLFTVHLRLGTFDLAHHFPARNGTRADVLGWSPAVRAAYSSSYKNCTGRPMNARIRGSPLKELHHAVFDALTDARPRRQVSVGAGVSMYHWCAQLMPESALRYLLGIGIATGEDEWEVLDRQGK